MSLAQLLFTLNRIFKEYLKGLTISDWDVLFFCTLLGNLFVYDLILFKKKMCEC